MHVGPPKIERNSSYCFCLKMAPEAISEHLISKNFLGPDPPSLACLLAYTVVSRKYAPPFATLALVQNVGGAYTRDATISLAITSSLPIKHDSLGGGWRPSTRRHRAQSGEMFPTLAVG